MCSKERLSITSARQNTSILKQKLLFITIIGWSASYKGILCFTLPHASAFNVKMSNCWKFFEIAVKECLTLTQEEYSWKFIPQILQQETQRKTSPPSYIEWIFRELEHNEFIRKYFIFLSRGREPPGGAFENDFRRVPRPMGHLRNSELPSPPSPFFYIFWHFCLPPSPWPPRPP